MYIIIFKMNEVNKLRHHSREYLMKFTNTTSLKELERVLSSNRTGTNLQYATAGYLFYNKKGVNLIKYDTLRRIWIEFVNAIESEDKNNPYYKVNYTIRSGMDKRSRERDLKKGILKDINKLINKLNVNLLFIAKETEVDYSSLYKFVKNDNLSALSLEKIHKILFYLRKLNNKLQ